MSLASHVPVGFHEEVQKLYDRILNNCDSLPWRTCATRWGYLESIGFEIRHYALREEEVLDGPFVHCMQLFNIHRDYKHVSQLVSALHIPQSGAVYRLCAKNVSILHFLRDNDVSIASFQRLFYLWPAFCGVCEDLKKLQEENADLRGRYDTDGTGGKRKRHGIGANLRHDNLTDLCKLLTSLSG
jgi:hypothetical protein